MGFSFIGTKTRLTSDIPFVLVHQKTNTDGLQPCYMHRYQLVAFNFKIFDKLYNLFYFEKTTIFLAIKFSISDVISVKVCR